MSSLRPFFSAGPSLTPLSARRWSGHLSGRGLTTPGLNFPERLFRGYWPVHQWEVEQGAFAQTYGEDFVPDDVALMLCYVSGNLPIAPEKEGAVGGDEGSLLTALSAAFSAMRGLPATSREWDRQIPDFIASVSRLVDEKAAQLQWTAEFDAILQSLRDQHGELLRFFRAGYPSVGGGKGIRRRRHCHDLETCRETGSPG